MWVANEGAAAISEFAGSVAQSGPSGFTGGGLSAAQYGIAVDGTGNVFTANFANDSVSKFSPSGVAMSGTSGFTVGGISAPRGIAIAADGEVVVSNQGTNTLTRMQNDGGGGFNFAVPALTFPTWVALDASSNIWTTSPGHSAIAKVSFAGSTLFLNGASGVNAPNAVAIDGAGNVWIANDNVNHISRLSNDTLTSVSYGLPNTGDPIPAIAIDSAGSVWFTEKANSLIIQFIGVGVPVVTPLSVAAQTGKLGSKP